MLWMMLVIGCQEATPNWRLLEPYGAQDASSSADQGATTALASQLNDAEEVLQAKLEEVDPEEGSQAQDGDGFDNPWGPDATAAEEIPVAAPEEEPATGSGDDLPDQAPQTLEDQGSELFGLPSSAAWGVRLLGTIAQSQPPRAALGLPDGTEVVVAPGSMLPSVGMVIISVGQNRVQVARVSPAGDHAEIEMVNLVAQYAQTAETPE